MVHLLEDVAGETLYLERPHVFRNPAEFHLCAPLQQIPGGYFSLGLTTNARLFRLNDVVLDADRAVLLHDDQAIDDTKYFMPKELHSVPDPTRTIQLPEGPRYIIGYNTAHATYHHWLIQCLPAIDWGLQLNRDRPVQLVLPKLAPWQEEMISLLGYGEVERVTVQSGHFYRLPQTEYAEYLNGNTAFNLPTTVLGTARRLLKRMPYKKSGTRILYVPHTTFFYGRLENESAVIDILRTNGATILDPRLRIADKMSLFRDADIIIGLHGSDLANILFARPGALLWEWTPQHYQNVVINRLAQLSQVDYWGDVLESRPAKDGGHTLSIDLDLFGQRLSDILGRVAERAVGESLPKMYATVQRDLAPMDHIMSMFQSLGQNCDFGLLQRYARVEPLGLLRFTGNSLNQLLTALDDGFSGVGDPANLRVVLAGEAPKREFMVVERQVGGYHTFILEGEMTEDEMRVRQARYLTFLRRKFLEDLRSGEKIWVWRETTPSSPERIAHLVDRLRRFGPNRLLWITVDDDTARHGRIESISPHLIRGYAGPIAADRLNYTTPLQPWFEICEKAYRVWRADLGDVEQTLAMQEYVKP